MCVSNKFPGGITDLATYSENHCSGVASILAYILRDFNSVSLGSKPGTCIFRNISQVVLT